MKRRLAERGLLDPRWRTVRRGDEVAFPVRDEMDAREVARKVDGRVLLLTDPEPSPRLPPARRVRRRLADVIPGDLHDLVPTSWDRVGDVVLLKLPDALAPHAALLGEAFGEELDAQAVLWDRGGVTGELREPHDRRLIWGDETKTIHREGGLAFEVDPTEVMWSSGNVDERLRMADVDASGEAVLDAFAGVGYLAIPLAARAGARRVVAVEKNPVAAAFLRRNVERNRVVDTVVPVEGDNRDLTEAGLRRLGIPAEGADRLVLGYLPGTASFLPDLLPHLAPGGVVHYHDTAPAEDPGATMGERLALAARELGREVLEADVRVVKSYAPGIVHAVVDARVG